MNCKGRAQTHKNAVNVTFILPGIIYIYYLLSQEQICMSPTHRDIFVQLQSPTIITSHHLWDYKPYLLMFVFCATCVSEYRQCPEHITATGRVVNDCTGNSNLHSSSFGFPLPQGGPQTSALRHGEKTRTNTHFSCADVSMSSIATWVSVVSSHQVDLSLISVND